MPKTKVALTLDADLVDIGIAGSTGRRRTWQSTLECNSHDRGSAAPAPASRGRGNRGPHRSRHLLRRGPRDPGCQLTGPPAIRRVAGRDLLRGPLELDDRSPAGRVGTGPADHHRRGRSGVRRASAPRAARPAPGGQPDARRSGALDHPGDPHPPGIQRLSDDPFDHDPDPAGPQRRHHAVDSPPWGRARRRGGRPGDPGVRRVRRRRSGARRRDPVLDPGRHPVRRHHPGRHPDQRGRRPVQEFIPGHRRQLSTGMRRR